MSIPTSTTPRSAADDARAAAPIALRTDGRYEPVGLDGDRPVLSWTASHSAASAEVQVGRRDGFAPADLVWAPGRRAGDAAFGATYAGPALLSRTTYAWRVRTWDDDDRVSEWSDVATFETGILHEHEWTASWIGAPAPAGKRKKDARALYFRGRAALSAPVVRARAYVTALGWYRLFVNGTDVTGHALVPRWTPFSEYVEYQVYDVTEQFREGLNAIGIAVADGRYRGTLGVLHRRANYGDRLGVLAQFEVDLADGTHVTIGSDGSWRVGDGRIRTADPKTGERVDLRISETDWLHVDGLTMNETLVTAIDDVPPRLIAEQTDRAQIVQSLPGIVSRTPSGVQLIDFGQNFAGVARVRLSGPAGRTVKLEYSEVLTPAGELDTKYLLDLGAGGEWFQRDEAILAGVPVDYTPWFTIHGFRYVAVHGVDRDLTPDDVEGLVLSSRMDTIAEFHASDPRLEQLWHNAFWSMRSNFVDTPSDCPTRERSGWTGDIQIFSPTALQLADSAPFLRRYLRNVATEQAPNGRIPAIIPAEESPGHSTNILLARLASTSVGWGDVAVMLPWNLYWYRGDTDTLTRQYDSAKAWGDQMRRRAAGKRRPARRLRRGARGLRNPPAGRARGHVGGGGCGGGAPPGPL
ncbi:family 78 glycoside hydrolase catalytic domain [Microbacterium gorillae]|uniref:family 78 glycoside hydrolase catalytic domain n=1 Tax=Microbacterium gorillae TaxID=1231063 RepID=UPI00058D7095|nr:family 78 glycoside hydrolase catalytic domain [Microbacterium gorillae]